MDLRSCSFLSMVVWRMIVFLLLFSCQNIFSQQLVCDVQAPVAILINAETGQVLYEKNAHKPCFPASTTKVATALYVLCLKNNDLDKDVLISHNAVAVVHAASRRQGAKHPSYRLEFGGTHMYLKKGELLPLRALLSGLMLCSANDAANALAEHVAGTIPKFMDDLNTFLRSLGCKNTHFTNPHGLHDVHHVTSAYDLALMARCAMRYTFFSEVVKATKYTRPKTDQQDPILLVQSNALVKPGKFYYPYAIGIKTGYTQAARSNLVAAAEKNGRKLIAVVLNCEDSNQRYRSCVTLFEKAFSEKLQQRILLSAKYDSFSYFINGGNKELKAFLKEDASIEYFPSEEAQYTASVEWLSQKPPIKEGQVVGSVIIASDKGKSLERYLLYAKDKVDPTMRYLLGAYIEYAFVVISRYKIIIVLYLGATLLGFSWFWKRRARFRDNRKV